MQSLCKSGRCIVAICQLYVDILQSTGSSFHALIGLLRVVSFRNARGGPEDRRTGRPRTRTAGQKTRGPLAGQRITGQADRRTRIPFDPQEIFIGPHHFFTDPCYRLIPMPAERRLPQLKNTVGVILNSALDSPGGQRPRGQG